MSKLTLIEKTIITNSLADLRTRKDWTLKEQCILFKIVQGLCPFMEMIKKDAFNALKYSDIDVSHIPNKYTFTRTELINIGFSAANFARDIDVTSDLLLEKKIKTSHPDIAACDESFAKAHWFNNIFYNKKEQKVEIIVNELILKIIMYFFKYTYLDLSQIVNIKSQYAFNIYVAIKMEIDYKKQTAYKYEISVDEFRESFDLIDKYRSINMLKKRALDIIKSEINEHTDLNLDYELSKDGARSFNTIIFNFSY
jgi:hypothetical protein